VRTWTPGKGSSIVQARAAVQTAAGVCVCVCVCVKYVGQTDINRNYRVDQTMKGFAPGKGFSSA